MSSPERIELEIVTPEGVALRATVDEVTAPSVAGDIGVLPGHRPLLAALHTGIVGYREGSTETRVAVGPGFAEVDAARVAILTDRFCRKEEIDPIAVRRDLLEADQALEAFDGEMGGPEHGALIRAERWAAMRLELYGDPPPPTVHTFDEFRTVSHPNFTAEDVSETSD
jgi:F-type H+-transporting ATPase subunit epsilon